MSGCCLGSTVNEPLLLCPGGTAGGQAVPKSEMQTLLCVSAPEAEATFFPPLFFLCTNIKIKEGMDKQVAEYGRGQERKGDQKPLKSPLLLEKWRYKASGFISLFGCLAFISS